MALLQQWRSKRSWFVDGLIVIGGGMTGLASLVPMLAPPFAEGAISSPKFSPWEHPLRSRIITTLDRSPGIHCRELQRRLDAANGTLRHHLDVLVNEDIVTIVPVNGRTCYYAGAPAQVEIFLGVNVSNERAASMMPVGLSDLQRKIVAQLSHVETPEGQAQLARDLGRSRSAVHSAIGVLRNRGILAQGRLDLADHLQTIRSSNLEYSWLDVRAEFA